MIHILRPFILLSLLFPIVLIAQEVEPVPVISGDRPGFGVSTANLQQGALQFESGLQFERNYSSIVFLGASDFIGNLTTVRYGITDKFEVKLDIPTGYNWFTQTVAPDPGFIFGGPTVGIRATMWQHETIGNFLFYGVANIRALSNLNDETSLGLDLRLLYNRVLTPTTSLDVNMGLHTPNGINTGEVYHGTVGITQSICYKWSVFGEYYYQYDTLQRPSNADGYSTHWVDAGAIFNPTPSTQIDFSAGYYLDNLLHDYVERAAPAFFISLGGAIRL